MTPHASVVTTDLAIVGSGMAGMAAAVFAANRGISTVLAGKSSAIHFASGVMDLMGVFPAGVEHLDPWSGIEQVKTSLPGHPYGKIDVRKISAALAEISDFLAARDLPYQRAAYRNIDIITSVGTRKKTYMVPRTMWKGIEAFETKAPTLLVDFTGLKLFSAKQIRACLAGQWEKTKAVCVDFPGTEFLEEVHPEHLARSMDLSQNRIQLAEKIKPFVKDVEYVGFPAMVGLYKSREALQEMESLLGAAVFEIPTPPVSVPGIRLHDAFQKGLEKKQCLHSLPEMVKDIRIVSNGNVRISAGSQEALTTIEAKKVILATGRFLGRGLVAGRTGIQESLLGLPVVQPETREEWHRDELFDPGGHEINRAGIETDQLLRPLAAPETPFADNLFAAGSILAHSDWTRLKCGSGVAMATAFAAVENIKTMGKF
ncbi:MAG: glycerol-3-phosphate dehydrogenase subunit GlpB [Desulfobacteraceae bacterium]